MRDGWLWTSTGRYNFAGITRRKVIELFRASGGVVHEIDFTAERGLQRERGIRHRTLGSVTPVTRIDGRTIGTGKPGSMTQRVRICTRTR